MEVDTHDSHRLADLGPQNGSDGANFAPVPPKFLVGSNDALLFIETDFIEG